MKAVLKVLGFCLLAVAGGAAASILLHLFHTKNAVGGDDIKYSDFLSITLTALSLMVTVLGLFVAAAGVIGWSTLENRLKAHSVDYFTKQLEKGAPLRKEFESLFVDIASTGIEGVSGPVSEEKAYDD